MENKNQAEDTQLGMHFLIKELNEWQEQATNVLVVQVDTPMTLGIEQGVLCLAPVEMFMWQRLFLGLEGRGLHPAMDWLCGTGLKSSAKATGTAAFPSSALSPDPNCQGKSCSLCTAVQSLAQEVRIGKI